MFLVMTYATADDLLTGTGTPYVRCESLATALNTATNLRQGGQYYHVLVFRAV